MMSRHCSIGNRASVGADCGGAGFVMVRYGNFFEYVRPITGGHASVGIELRADALQVRMAVDEVLAKNGLLEPAAVTNRA